MQEMLLTLLVATLCFTKTRVRASCANPRVQKEFNIEEYVGTWYEIERLSPNGKAPKCSSETYMDDSNGMLRILIQEITENGEMVKYDAQMFKESQKEPAKRIIIPYDDHLSQIPFGGISAALNYFVLSTDYRNYSLVYSCHGFPGKYSNKKAWILSRERTLSANITSRLRNILTSNKIDTEHMIVTDQSDCPSF
ncbi:apolipoprotein D [Callorhinchus milii]|uniref:Apolipoprotein D n=1 Tax=Callorhinchus milii TaxID=7868 RepID=V9LC58_CALMI|nr:apolipoprotein D [Callorhinchus milii]XP_042195254.1 apolipoprotein D [Callorhinchus milii]|eukprot:gi/632933986/ref/XP_007895412.1/ PREDICTED: apolipoprotein D-like [Callorhinchus milii]